MSPALTILGSLVTSFVGSFLCFVVWIHFDFEERWQARREVNRLRNIQRGRDIENERRLREGLPPL